MSNPLVSVCINAYNAEKYIRETVDSVLNQTYTNLQIIVVDDCSTDNTYEILKSIDDPRLEIYRLPYNCHISNACNEGFKHVKGEYVAHLDADDLWVPEKIEKQVEFLESNSNYGACFTHVDVIDDEGNIGGSDYDSFRELFAFTNHSQSSMYRFFFDKYNRLCHSSSVIRRELVKQVGNHDVSFLYLHDFDYWMRLLTVTPIFILPERLTLYRQHQESNSDMSQDKWIGHDTEKMRLLYKTIEMCPDDLFLEAFSDKLHLIGKHTHEEVEIEKALFLLEGTIAYIDNPVLGLYKFSQLFAEEKYIKLAKEKFNFSTRDFYKIQQKQAYFDPQKNTELLNSLKYQTELNEQLNAINISVNSANNELSTANDELHSINSKLNQANENLSAANNQLTELNKSLNDNIDNLNGHIRNLDSTIHELNTQVFNYSSQLFEIQNSFFWRLTTPFRKTVDKVKNFAKSHERLLLLLIYSKGFLRGGFKSAKKRVDDYLKYKVQINKIAERYDNCLTLHVPEDVCKEHKNFKFTKNILFSVIVPLYNTPLDFLEQMIKSVELQTYENWELCLADGSDSKHSEVRKFCLKKAKTDSRIKYKKLSENKGISENTNECIKMATGDYIALFDHDDILDPTALFEYAKVICEEDADFIYCDEDKFDKFGGKLYDANFKPDFAIDNLRANNYICHFTVFEKSLLEQCGMFRKEFDGSQDHDIILRLTEKAKKIIHIPKVLYHWRVSAASVASDPYAKPYTIEAGIKAVSEHLERVGLKGSVESSKIHPNIYRVKYDIIGNPLVSIIIPNYNHVEDLSRCINSIIKLSTYKNYEIIIVENNSNKETFEYYETLKNYDNIKVVVYDREGGFNYSAINNFGVKYAKGEHYILLNNDIEIITPEWIEEMLMYSQRADVGAVGAMLYYPNDTIQHAGVTIGVLTLAGHNFKHSQRGNPGYFGRAGYQQNVSAVTAACLMLSAKVYDEVNGLDEQFEVAFNDIDLCMRIRKAGYLIVFTPFAELYHYESVSRGDDSSPEKRARFVSEVSRFQTRWKKELDAGDPYYNPNLTLEREDFSLK